MKAPTKAERATALKVLKFMQAVAGETRDAAYRRQMRELDVDRRNAASVLWSVNNRTVQCLRFIIAELEKTT